MRLLTTLLIAIYAIAMTGCGHTYITNRITLIDAESERPIPGARVGVFYGGWSEGSFSAPTAAWGTTSEDGTLDLRVTVDRDRRVLPTWSTEPDGYFRFFESGEFNPMIAVIDQKIAAGESEDIVRLTVRCWRKPSPVVRVTIPAGYRGFVRICPSIAPYESPEPSQRLFDCVINASGLCWLPRASILTEAPVEIAYEFCFDDGSPLPRGSHILTRDGTALAAWSTWHVDKCPTFIVAEESVAWSEQRSLRSDGSSAEVYQQFAERVRTGRLHSGE